MQIVSCRNISERFRIREIELDGNIRPEIPLDLGVLHHRDQDLPSSGFQDVKSLTLGFHSDLGRLFLELFLDIYRNES